MEAVISLVALLTMSLTTYFGVRWMLKLGKSGTVSENPLSPADLAVLEETAARLLSDIRSVTDECVGRIDAACERARELTDAPIGQWPQAARCEETPAGSVSSLLAQYQPGEPERSSPEPASATASGPTQPRPEATTGEMQLVKSLEKLRNR